MIGYKRLVVIANCDGGIIHVSSPFRGTFWADNGDGTWSFQSPQAPTPHNDAGIYAMDASDDAELAGYPGVVVRVEAGGIVARGERGWRAEYVRAYLYDADLSGTNLRRANLCHANLHWASLSGVDLAAADLAMANLRDADLRHANLFRVNLRRANLHYADLRWADLGKAILHYADLGGARLEGANLEGAEWWNRDAESIQRIHQAACGGDCTWDEERREMTFG